MRLILPGILLMLSCLSVEQAWAQWGAPAKQPLDRATIEANKKKSKAKFTSKRLDKLQTIPYVPQYPATGKNIMIVRAIQYSTLGKGDNCIVQTFLVKDPAANVRDWYKQGLNNYGWKVQSANKTETQILGRRVKDGSSVHIMVLDSTGHKKDGFKSQVQLRYVQWVPFPSDK